MVTDASVYERAFDVHAIVARLKARIGVKSDKEFAGKLNISQSTLASWKNRGSIPLNHLIAIAQALQVSTDWIFFGEPIQVNIAAKDIDNSIIRLAITTAIESEIEDEERKFAVTEKAMMYYNMLRSISSEINKIHPMSNEQRMKQLQDIMEKVAESVKN